METALWSAIALVAALSMGTLFLVVTRIDALSPRIDGRFDALAAESANRSDALTSRIDALATETANRFDAMAARFDALSAHMNGRFDRVDDRLTSVEHELHQHVSRHAG